VGDAATKAAFIIEGRDSSRASEVFFTNHRRVRPGYFEAMGIRPVQGRLLEERDNDAAAPGVVVVSQAMARQFWPGEDPLGKRVKRGWSNADDLPWLTVVGVVEDVRDAGLAGEVEPTWYLPEAQHDTQSLSLVVQTATEPLAVAQQVQKAVLAVDREQPVFRLTTLAELVQGSVSKHRFVAYMLGAFAALGLVLAAAGIYGALSYMVTRRFREMGLRMALGADRTDVLLHVLRYGAVLAGAGLILGLAGAVLLTRLLSGLLYEVSPTDPAVLAGMALFLAAVSLVAIFLPARRVTRVDPVIALRQD
jgi:putative ABC transport system permease protein